MQFLKDFFAGAFVLLIVLVVAFFIFLLFWNLGHKVVFPAFLLVVLIMGCRSIGKMIRGK